MLDDLTAELRELKTRLDAEGVSFVLGGGMGLYLRDVHLGGDRSPRYPVRPTSRSTKDLDLLLSADVIASDVQMTALRDVIEDMGYVVHVKYTQFKRRLDAAGRELKIDLLCAPAGEGGEVKSKGIRVRPHSVERIHGRLTSEAEGISLYPVTLSLPDSLEVNVPSSLNYVVLKLHAFHDRKDRTDDASDLGRHHAFDVFRVMTDMRESDWESARAHVEAHGGHEYLRRAAAFQHEYFEMMNSLGALRVQEDPGFSEISTFRTYLGEVLADLVALFEGVEPLSTTP